MEVESPISLSRHLHSFQDILIIIRVKIEALLSKIFGGKVTL